MVQGELVYAANLLHDSFFRIFMFVFALERSEDAHKETRRFHNHALAIWHTVQSDSSQRQMANAALSTVPSNLKLKPAIAAVDWADKMAARLGGYRNLVAHSPVIFNSQPNEQGRWELVPIFYGDGQRPIHTKRLSIIGGDLGFWQMIRDDLLSLEHYVETVYQQLQRIAIESRGSRVLAPPSTWPRKPRLKSLPLLLEIDQKIRSPSPKLKRRSQQRASRR